MFSATMSKPMSGRDLANTGVTILPGTPLAEVERVIILETLRSQRFNRTRTAKVLGIGIRTLQRKLKQYRLEETGSEMLAKAFA